MNPPRHANTAFISLELLLVLSILILVLQVFPSSAKPVLWLVDLRNWSTWGWFAFFALLCGFLCNIEYQFFTSADLKEWLSVRVAKLRRRKESDSRKAKKEALAKERALYKRIIESRSRRL